MNKAAASVFQPSRFLSSICGLSFSVSLPFLFLQSIVDFAPGNKQEWLLWFTRDQFGAHSLEALFWPKMPWPSLWKMA